MAEMSKNARTGVKTQRFQCACGGEIKNKSLFEKGKIKNFAVCEKCNRKERKIKNFS